MDSHDMEGKQIDITKLWDKMGSEGEGGGFKQGARRCLYGVQDDLMHPDVNTMLHTLAKKYGINHDSTAKHFTTFKSALENGLCTIELSFEKERLANGKRAVYLRAVAKAANRPLSNQDKQDIEEVACKVALEAITGDIDRMLKMEHVVT